MAAANVPPAGPASTSSPTMPSSAGYWIGTILLVLSVVGGAILFTIGVSRAVSLSTTYSIDVPGDSTRTLDAGTYELYTSGLVNYDYDTTPIFTVVGPDGATVAVSTLSGPTHSSYSSSRNTIASFVAPQHGGYQIKAAYRDDRPGRPSSGIVPRGPSTTSRRNPTTTSPTFDEEFVYPEFVTLSRGGGEVASASVPWILGGSLGGVLLFIVGLVLVIVTAVRRSSARKRLNPPRPPGPYGPPGAAPWAAYPPPGAYPGPGPYGAPPPGAGPYGQPPPPRPGPPPGPGPGPYGQPAPPPGPGGPFGGPPPGPGGFGPPR